MNEWGIFNDEGCLERGLWSQAQADTALNAYSEEDEVHAAPICRDHEDDEQEDGSCWLCDQEQEEDEDD